jgi:hypothetical protein
MSKAIGGYFELELNKGAEYHTGAIRLNTGRNAFEYVLRARKYRKVYLRYYTCDVMLQPILKLGLEHEFYHINAEFEPCFEFSSLQTDEAFVYTNYFGLKDRYVEVLAHQCRNLIIDNAQAFFSKPVPGIDTFYSPRKFFGVPDGAYLYTDRTLTQNLEQDYSNERLEHLLLRVEYGAEEGYSHYVQNSRNLDNLPIRRMSKLTRLMLQNIDYMWASNIRKTNFLTLHNELGDLNTIGFSLADGSVPMVYPFTIGLGELRQQLIESRIYVAKYWPNVKQWTQPGDLEYLYSEHIIPLPIDQRYSVDDMRRIVTTVKRQLQ